MTIYKDVEFCARDRATIESIKTVHPYLSEALCIIDARF